MNSWRYLYTHKKEFLHKLVDHCEEDLPKEEHEQLCMLLLAYVDIFADRDATLDASKLLVLISCRSMSV